MTLHNILIVGGDSEALSAAGRILEKNRYEVMLASSADSAIKFLKMGGVAIALIDLSRDDTTAASILGTVRETSPDTMVVLQAESDDVRCIKNMFNNVPADDCILKPYQPEELLFRVKKNIELHELKQKIRSQKRFYSSCCVCKKIRIDDYGPDNYKWMEVEDFLKEEMDILLSSTYCPKCAQAIQEDLLVQIDRLKA